MHTHCDGPRLLWAIRELAAIEFRPVFAVKRFACSLPRRCPDAIIAPGSDTRDRGASAVVDGELRKLQALGRFVVVVCGEAELARVP